MCCNEMSKNEIPSKFCLLIIFLCCGDAERVLVRAWSLRASSPLAFYASRATGLRIITTPSRPRLQERTVPPCQMIRNPSISSLSRPEGTAAHVSCSAAAWIPILHGVDNHIQLLRCEPSHVLRYKPHACLCIELRSLHEPILKLTD